MQRFATTCLLILSFLGIADAWYLAESALTDTALTCNINGLEGCNVVAQSQYAHLFGVPLGVYGVVFYVLFFVLSALLLVNHSRLVRLGLLILGSIGVIASAIFEAIQFFLINALCVYCLGSAAISVLLFLFAIWIWKQLSHAPLPSAAP